MRASGTRHGVRNSVDSRPIGRQNLRSVTERPEIPTVSIIVCTVNRLALLKRCIAHLRENVSTSKEIIVVDGASDDGTGVWLAEQSDLHVITETQREGAARAFDRGFRAARGTYLMWLNDDSYPLPGAIEAAIALIERPDLTDVGLVALYHNFDREWNRLDDVMHDGQRFSIYNVRGEPYANFGLLRRSLMERLDFLDLRYHFGAWDPDLSLKVQREAGLKVVGCRRSLVVHDELIDERKAGDLDAMAADNEKLFAKWNLPAKDSYPDPRPAYQAMLVQRGIT